MNDRRYQRVAVREVGSDEIVIHAAGDGGGNYDTLCGVSTSDDMFEEVDSAPRGRIDCPTCWSVYQLARSFNAADFTTKMRKQHGGE